MIKLVQIRIKKVITVNYNVRFYPQRKAYGIWWYWHNKLNGNSLPSKNPLFEYKDKKKRVWFSTCEGARKALKVYISRRNSDKFISEQIIYPLEEEFE